MLMLSASLVLLGLSSSSSFSSESWGEEAGSTCPPFRRARRFAKVMKWCWFRFGEVQVNCSFMVFGDVFGVAVGYEGKVR